MISMCGTTWDKIFLHGLKIVGLVALYYPFSIGLTFYQKWFIKDFKFPLTVVCCHYILKFLSASVMRKVYTMWTKRDRIMLGWADNLSKVAPVGVAASVDIGLSNWAFEYITVSLYTMAKSTAIIFMIGFAILLSLEHCNWSLPLVIVCLSVGLFLFTFRSTQFDLTGFVLVEMAALCCGVRWAFSQLLMQRETLGLRSPVDMIFHVQPWMVLAIIPLAFAFEGESISTSAKGFEFKDIHIPMRFSALIVVGGMIAFLMELAEYLLLVHTSSLTVSIAGIFKEIVTLVLAHRFNHDQMSTINSIGLSLLIVGISVHVFHKWKRQRDEAEKALKQGVNTQGEEMETPLLNPSFSDSEQEELSMETRKRTNH